MALLQDNPDKPASEHLAIVDFNVAPAGTAYLPLHTNPVLNTTGWHTSGQSYRNITLKGSR